MSILLSDLTKRYGETLVVNRVSLEVLDGELFVLLGSSGSGKSTVLRLIAGLTPLDQGRIVLNHKDVTHLPPQKRDTGFVFQNYSIFRHMNVYENIEFGLRIRKAQPGERRRRSEELLDLVGLAGLGGRFPDQLSGGQRQRVALARALAYQPAVLLLDEPFGALDVKIRAQLRESLKEIQRRLQVTTILVTHDQEEAFELGDRIGVIERGSLVEIGRPEELYHRPHTEYAATFIGGGNVLVGRVQDGMISLGSACLPFPEGAPRHDEGAPVRILFRPETVSLQAQPITAEKGVHPLASGRVLERIFAGSQQRIRLEVDGLRGVRPINPPPVYGRQTTQIEVLETSQAVSKDALVQEKLYIGLRSYHVLNPTGLKILICTKPERADEEVVSFGSQLARAAGGPTTLLSVLRPGEGQAACREKLDALRTKYFSDSSQLECRLRSGLYPDEILLEAQEGTYELVILGRRFENNKPAPTGTTVRQVMARAELPVMLVPENSPEIRRILICTAAGEPGKSDVLFGGRVARQIRAEVLVYHVLRPRAQPEDRRRAELHLSQSQASLESLGVSCTTRLESETTLLEGITQQVEMGGYNLIVIGAPAPRSPQQLIWSDLASQILRRATRPLLVVPMTE